MSEKEKEEIKKLEIGIIRDTGYFTQSNSNQYEDKLPETPSGKYVVDDSCFVPMSEAIKQLSRVADPSNAQLAEVYDFPNGKDNGKRLPITRQRDFHDLAEYSQEIRQNAQNMNNEILKGELEAAEKSAFAKELETVRAEASQSTSKK